MAARARYRRSLPLAGLALVLSGGCRTVEETRRRVEPPRLGARSSVAADRGSRRRPAHRPQRALLQAPGARRVRRRSRGPHVRPPPFAGARFHLDAVRTGAGAGPHDGELRVRPAPAAHQAGAPRRERRGPQGEGRGDVQPGARPRARSTRSCTSSPTSATCSTARRSPTTGRPICTARPLRPRRRGSCLVSMLDRANELAARTPSSIT